MNFRLYAISNVSNNLYKYTKQLEELIKVGSPESEVGRRKTEDGSSNDFVLQATDMRHQATGIKLQSSVFPIFDTYLIKFTIFKY